MKQIASLLLLLCGTTLVACNTTGDSAYEVEDANQVTLLVTGMT